MCTLLDLLQALPNSRYYRRTGTVRASVMSRVQLLLVNALATDRCFWRWAATTAVRSSATSTSCALYNHESVQKKSDSPLPSVIRMDALKKAAVLVFSLGGRDAHGRPRSERWSHNQRTLGQCLATSSPWFRICREVERSLDPAPCHYAFAVVLIWPTNLAWTRCF
jgi:hypothetical protein